MRNRLSGILIFFLILGLFSACSSPVDGLDALTERLSSMEGYAFTAGGEVRFESEAEAARFHAPHRYVIEGARFSGDVFATLYYIDGEGRASSDVSLFYANGSAYVGFVPFFRQMVAERYPENILPVENVLGSHLYFAHPGLSLSDFPLDFPALIAALPEQALRQNLTYEAGAYEFFLTGDALNQDILSTISRPFELYADLYALVAPIDEMPEIGSILALLLAGDMAEYTLALTFAHDEEDDVFMAWLTLTVPGQMTITADVVYREIPRSAVTPPQNAIEMRDVQDLALAYREALERALFLRESGLEIIYDLPELHMVGHSLNTELLIPFDMEIGGRVFTVSVMEGANNSVANWPRIAVFSVTPTMTITYTALAAHLASETMAPFVLQDLDVESFDAGNFQRTAMRINARDTAAVKALYYDDNFVGRTLHIYVLQNLDDSDYALFLSILVMLDNLAHHSLVVLEELGFLIGIDFLEYVTLAAQRDSGDDDE